CRCKEWNVEPEAVQQQCRIKLDVRLQVAPGFVLFQQTQRDFLDSSCKFIQLYVVAAAEHPFCSDGEHIGARVAHFINAMPETHSLLAAREFLEQIRLGACDITDLEDHI